MIYQELSLAPHLSVMENVLLGMEFDPTGLARHAGGLESQADAGPGRCGACRVGSSGDFVPTCPFANCRSPRPNWSRSLARWRSGAGSWSSTSRTSSLGQHDIEKLFELIGRLKQQGHAIVYISHFLEEVRRISDRFTVLRDGRTVGSGTTDEVDNDRLIRMMVGPRSRKPVSPFGPGDGRDAFENRKPRRRPLARIGRRCRCDVARWSELPDWSVRDGRSCFARFLVWSRSARVKCAWAFIRGAALPETRWRQGMGPFE